MGTSVSPWYTAHKYVVLACAWSPDGTQLASTTGDDPDGLVIIWDVDSWEEVVRLEAGAYTRPLLGST